MASVPSEYRDGMIGVLNKLDTGAIDKAVAALKAAYDAHKRVFTCGNGGSAATATHFAADFEKNGVPGGRKPRTLSLAADTSKLTAYGNDIAFDTVFAEQLTAQADAGDVLVAVSASGNSPDIVKAAKAARALGVTVIGLSAMGGGALRSQADISIHVDTPNYEEAEDAHSIVLHACVRAFKALARD